jgi:hypothetical protein
MTIDALSMLYPGLSEPAFQTETYLLNTETGKIHTEGFAIWRDRDVWKSIATEVIGEVYTEWLMIDATYSKVHADGCGAVGGNQAIGRTKGGSIPKSTLL